MPPDGVPAVGGDDSTVLCSVSAWSVKRSVSVKRSLSSSMNAPLPPPRRPPPAPLPPAAVRGAVRAVSRPGGSADCSGGGGSGPPLPPMLALPPCSERALTPAPKASSRGGRASAYSSPEKSRLLSASDRVKLRRLSPASNEEKVLYTEYDKHALRRDAATV